MNMQAMMKQVQKLQSEMTNEKNKIDSEIFNIEKSFIKIEMKGTKEITNIKIDKEKIESDEIDILEDFLLVALNEIILKIDSETEKRLGKYTKGMPGLF